MDHSEKKQPDHQELPLSPPYLKLIADCWEHIFDLLSLNDILVMGETCKRMHQMAGYYLREYFPELRFTIDGRKVKVDRPFSFHLPADYFPYISALCIDYQSRLNHTLDAEQFSSVKTLTMDSFNLIKQIGYIKSVLKNVENLQIKCCEVSPKTLEKLAKYCTNLKCLRVKHFGNNRAVAKSMFSQQFPSLEYISFVPYCPSDDKSKPIVQLKTFLQKHPQLKRFESNVNFLWQNSDLLLSTNNVQSYSLIVNSVGDFDNDCAVDEFTNYLKKLFERGFYKTLKLSVESTEDFEQSTNAISLVPALEMLDVSKDSFIDLSRLTGLRELHITNHSKGIGRNMETLARSLVKLERLSFHSVSVDHILPFICHSKGLKSIHINFLHEFVIDLFAFNEKRKMLDDAHQVLIYLVEDKYLAVKWKPYLNLSHVKLLRAGTEYKPY